LSFNLDPGFLLLQLLPGAVGFVLLAYGRSQSRPPLIVGGLCFIALTWVVDTVSGLLIGSAVISLGMWAAIRQGW
jgi:hypothetical protein